jgi:hypothetical protein
MYLGHNVVGVGRTSGYRVTKVSNSGTYYVLTQFRCAASVEDAGGVTCGVTPGEARNLLTNNVPSVVVSLQAGTGRLQAAWG